uniref:Tail protein n=1 Tax=viral metagenome TaxID=1070528 RepID=A0A6H1Z897_9ZZZZ
MPLPHTPKTDWDPADGVAAADLNEVGDNLVALETHIDATTGIHGAVAAATASKLVIRDAAGRAAVADPAAAGDIVNKQTLEVHTGNTANPHSVTKTQVGLANVTDNAQMPIAGGTFTGKAYAQSNTDYTTGQIRNIFFSAAAPTTEGANGDLWVQY